MKRCSAASSVSVEHDRFDPAETLAGRVYDVVAGKRGCVHDVGSWALRTVDGVADDHRRRFGVCRLCLEAGVFRGGHGSSAWLVGRRVTLSRYGDGGSESLGER